MTAQTKVIGVAVILTAVIAGSALLLRDNTGSHMSINGTTMQSMMGTESHDMHNMEGM